MAAPHAISLPRERRSRDFLPRGGKHMIPVLQLFGWQRLAQSVREFGVSGGLPRNVFEDELHTRLSDPELLDAVSYSLLDIDVLELVLGWRALRPTFDKLHEAIDKSCLF